MAIPLVKAGGWAYREKLTSAQMNAFQTSVNERAADTYTGMTCTFDSHVVFNEATTTFYGDIDLRGYLVCGNATGRVIPRGLDGDIVTNHTIALDSGELIRIGTLDGTCTLSLTSESADTTGWIEFSCRHANPGYPTLVKDVGANTIITLGWNENEYVWAKVIWDGSQWQVWTAEMRVLIV